MHSASKGNACGLQGSAFGVQCNAFGVQSNAFGVQCNAFGVQSNAFRVQSNAFGVQGNAVTGESNPAGCRTFPGSIVACVAPVAPSRFLFLRDLKKQTARPPNRAAPVID